MAFNLFSDNRILNIDVNAIPSAFLNYYDSVDDNRKKAIALMRPDLIEKLGLSNPESNEKKEEIAEAVLNVDTEKDSDFFDNHEFDEIKKNVYEHINLKDYLDNVRGKKFLGSKINKFEAFIISDDVDKCFLHHKKLIKYDTRFVNGNGGDFGAYIFYCPDCNRLYVQNHTVLDLERSLIEGRVSYKLFNESLSKKYLKSLMEYHEFGEDEKIYITEPWIEEDPLCPIHKKSLFEIKCKKCYKNRTVKFYAHACEDCNRIFARPSKIGEINDLCAEKGVPQIEHEELYEEIPKNKKLQREIKIDFYVDNGRVKEFSFNSIVEKYMIDESDTVIISDSTGCSIFDHDTEDILICFNVLLKKGGQKKYLCKAGYCKVCQKFYLEEADYKALYAIGRPCANIMVDTHEDEYYISSGEVFNLENEHLNRVERVLDDEVKRIKSNPDYIAPYEKNTGELPHAAFLAKKEYSLKHFEPQIDKKNDEKQKPYVYRVDLIFMNDVKTYYVGADEIELSNGMRVISFNYDFGRKIVNTKNNHHEIDGKIYETRLIRILDIDNETLFGYSNLRTQEDLIFKSGITDPFLVRVLKTRKKQHNLIDILATIQENQDKIVEADYSNNIIVQGCAGSGKTMVLLHRLSYLKYNNEKLFDEKKTVIITPNEQFNLHIKGLADELQLEKIDRIPIEQYYLKTLQRYGFNYKSSTKISSEISMNQAFVDYIYSDDFIEEFDKAFKEHILERNKIIEVLDNLTDAMGESRSDIDIERNDVFISTVQRKNEHLLSKVNDRKNNVFKFEREKNDLETRKKHLINEVSNAKERAEKIVPVTLNEVNIKIVNYVNSLNQKIFIYEEELTKNQKELRETEKSRFTLGKRSKIDKLTEEKNVIERNLQFEKTRMEDFQPVIDNKMHTKSDEEILDWMIQVALYIPEVKSDREKCLSAKRKYKELIQDISSTEESIKQTEEKLQNAKENLYSKEVEKTIKDIAIFCEDRQDIHLEFRRVFYRTVKDYLEKNNLSFKAGIRRYDLYAEILFAQRFFGKNVGQDTFICVDEGQSLAFNEYKLLDEINNGKAIFNVYGDTNQLLKIGRGISNWDSLEKYFDSTRFILNENYRNTNQITRFCNESFGMNVLQTGVDGVKVKEIAREELESELSKININERRIAILIPRCVRKIDYLDMDSIEESIRRIIKSEIGNGIISYMYVDEVRGIEFDSVYVITNKMSRNEKYIAYTRALSELIIVVDEQVQDAVIEDIQEE